jgi:hypothetical protein
MKRRQTSAEIPQDLFDLFHGIRRTHEEVATIERETGGVYDVFLEFEPAECLSDLWTKHEHAYRAECRRLGIEPKTEGPGGVAYGA